MELQLLGTEGCHLCDEAERMVRRIAPNFGYTVTYLDIASDDGLVERFGMEIPVLRLAIETQHQLNWPFDDVSLINWLQNPKQ